MAAKVQASLEKPCLLICNGPVHIADDAAALHLYRIAQEAVNNAVRHSKARQIRIELSTIPGAVTLGVHDDGVGLPVASSGQGKGMGISVMHYRSRMIGANLEIRSGEAGTSVICSYPVENNESNPTSPQRNSGGAGLRRRPSLSFAFSWSMITRSFARGWRPESNLKAT